jgi:hypothetical protein
MNQGNSIARITAMGFIFLPLSFVAVSYHSYLTLLNPGYLICCTVYLGHHHLDCCRSVVSRCRSPSVGHHNWNRPAREQGCKTRESIKLYPSNGKKAPIATESIIPTPSPLKRTVEATPIPAKAEPSILNHEREIVPIIVRSPTPPAEFRERSSFIEAR